MFKTETHLHTKETSSCSRLFAKEMVELYHNAGYKTIFVSDHMHHDFLEANSDVSREEAVRRFLSGYNNAKAEAEKYGMNVLLSTEYSLTFGNIDSHYLVYGIDEDFLLENANCADFTLERLRAATKKKGALLIEAHPFRGVCIPTPTFVDGVEIYNPNPRHFVESDEVRTLEIAKLYGLYISAGSDAHRTEDIAGSGMGSDHEIKTAEDFIELIKSGKGTVLRK